MLWKNNFAVAFAGQCSLVLSSVVDKRIINGEAAQAGDFPYIVSIRRWDGFHNCGGVLLDSTTVLTASHCANDMFSTSIRAGALNQTTGGVVSDIASRKKHPEYKSRTAPGEPYQPNDIAILKLKTPIEKSDTVAYAKLPTRCSDPAASSAAIAAGWGSIKDMLSGEVELLNKASLSVVDRDECRKLEPEVGDRDTVLCVDGDKKNVCKNDSGGPLVDAKTSEIIGVASFIIPQPGYEPGYEMLCAAAPSLFTRVASYIPWILENMGSAEQGPGTKTPESCTQPGGSPAAQPEPAAATPEPVDRQKELESYCGRPGNDNKACMRAAFRCTGTLPDTAPMVEFGECVDRMQVCKDEGANTDQCVAKAKDCKEAEDLALGDLAGLTKCVKSVE